ncbi:MAG: hypothetical protein WHT65_02120 [Pseudothermotoga sp.]
MFNFAIFLIAIGALLIVSALGYLQITFGKFFSILFSVIFLYSGVSAIIKRGFPSGLISLSIASLILLNAFEICSLGLWRSVAIVIGVALIELGIKTVKIHRKSIRWDFRDFV